MLPLLSRMADQDWTGTSVLYHVLNFVGAAGLLVNALHHHTFPSMTVNVVWAVIAVWGLAVVSRRRTPD